MSNEEKCNATYGSQEWLDYWGMNDDYEEESEEVAYTYWD